MSGPAHPPRPPCLLRWILAFVAVAGAVGLGACGAAAPDREPGTEVIALGAAVYQANCATCHGVSGAGQPNWQSRQAGGTLPAPPHDASGHTWHHPDAVCWTSFVAVARPSTVAQGCDRACRPSAVN